MHSLRFTCHSPAACDIKYLLYFEKSVCQRRGRISQCLYWIPQSPKNIFQLSTKSKTSSHVYHQGFGRRKQSARQTLAISETSLYCSTSAAVHSWQLIWPVLWKSPNHFGDHLIIFSHFASRPAFHLGMTFNRKTKIWLGNVPAENNLTGACFRGLNFGHLSYQSRTHTFVQLSSPLCFQGSSCSWKEPPLKVSSRLQVQKPPWTMDQSIINWVAYVSNKVMHNFMVIIATALVQNNNNQPATLSHEVLYSLQYLLIKGFGQTLPAGIIVC